MAQDLSAASRALARHMSERTFVSVNSPEATDWLKALQAASPPDTTDSNEQTPDAVTETAQENA
jgi:hypothetical protein